MEEKRYEGKKVSIKSKGNWALSRGLSQSGWDKIFGKKKLTWFKIHKFFQNCSIKNIKQHKKIK